MFTEKAKKKKKKKKKITFIFLFFYSLFFLSEFTHRFKNYFNCVQKKKKKKKIPKK